jgi:hypothetical protein
MDATTPTLRECPSNFNTRLGKHLPPIFTSCVFGLNRLPGNICDETQTTDVIGSLLRLRAAWPLAGG